MKHYLNLIILALIFNPFVAIAETNGNVNKSSLEDVKAIFNDTNCDVVFIDYFTTCYNYSRRSAVAVYTEVKGYLVENENSIDKRPSFYTDERIEKGFEITTDDYSNTGYDRGHFGASDASFDWGQEALESSYKMSNIVPQTPRANRYKFVALEKLEREMAVKHKVLETVSIAFWNDRPKKIGKNQMHVPSAFAKVFTSLGYRECFFIWNDDQYDSKTGKDPYSYKIDCNKVFDMVGTTVGKAEEFGRDHELKLKELLEFYKTTGLDKKQTNAVNLLINSLK